MTPEKWQAVRAAFDELAELPRAQHAERLARLADAEISREVRRLLDHLGDVPSTFLATPPPAVRALHQLPALLTAGELLAGRYRIIQPLGHGGMGEVYEAHDLVLDLRVALKTVIAGAGDEASKRRLLGEVSLARRITHPNVCRTFDIAIDQERTLLFLTMELVEGETLARILKRRNRLGSDEVRNIARQIFAALAAAHDCNILHRDLKPANLMLAGERLLILDFGLAKKVEPSRGGAEQSGSVYGTPEYLAPELLTGAESERSDLYSAGVILFECLTGSRPQGSDGAALAAEWRKLLGALLQADPQRRPGSAHAALAMLEAQPRLGTRRRLLIGGAVGLPAISVSLWQWISRLPSRGTPALRGVQGIVMRDIANLTQQPELDGIATAFRSQLDQSAYLQAVSPEQMDARLAQMGSDRSKLNSAEVLRGVALRERAQFVAFGELAARGTGYEFGLTLEQMGSGPTTPAREWSERFPAASKQDIFNAVRRGGEWLRRTAGEAPAQISDQDRPVPDLTSPSWEAIRLYQKALGIRHLTPDVAVTHAREAVALDDGFAAAHALVADLYHTQRRFHDSFQSYRQAIQAARRRQLTNRERLRMEAYFYYQNGDYAEAEQACRAWIAHYPGDAAPRITLAVMRMHQGAFPQSIRLLTERLAVEDDFVARVHLASALIGAEQPTAALEQAGRLGRMGQTLWAHLVEGRAKFCLGDPSAAEAAFRKVMAEGSDHRRSVSTLILAAVLAETGQREAARSALRAGIADDRASGAAPQEAAKLISSAYLALQSGSLSSAQEEARAAVAVDKGMETLLRAGLVLARSGNTSEARRAAAGLTDWREYATGRAAAALVDAECALSEGRPGTANGLLAKLDKALFVAESLDLQVRVLAALRRPLPAEVLSPARVWSEDQVWPGLWGDLLAVAASSKADPEQARQAGLRLTKLRSLAQP